MFVRKSTVETQKISQFIHFYRGQNIKTAIMCQGGLISSPDLNDQNYLLQMKTLLFFHQRCSQVSERQCCNTVNGASFHRQTQTLNSLMF